MGVEYNGHQNAIGPEMSLHALFRRLRVALAMLFVAHGALTTTGAAAGPERPPNVVLIISDDHGWTDYGFMGHRQVATPRLDRLAAEGRLFRRGYVPSSLCCPSLATILTGRYPHQHLITSNDPPIPPGLKPGEFHRSAAFREGREAMCRHLEAIPTLPRLLAGRDYLSLQTGKWWQGDYRRGGFTHGMSRGDRHGDDGLRIGRGTMQPMVDFIAQAQDEGRPFLLWYAPMMPHTPHNPPARLLDMYAGRTASPHVARYWAMIEWFDESCGQLLDHLDQQGLADDTIVLYLADNGWTQDPDGPGFVRSKRSPHDAGLRTPIIVRWPGHVAPGESDRLAMSIDVVPTVLAAVGQSPPADLAGLDLLDDAALAQRPAIHGECFTHNAIDLDRPAANLLHRWIIRDPWKLIVPHGNPAPDESFARQVELYDILADPTEQTNLAGERPDVVAELTGALDAWWLVD
jgi:arylsulfatase A-like enzyme